MFPQIADLMWTVIPMRDITQVDKATSPSDSIVIITKSRVCCVCVCVPAWANVGVGVYVWVWVWVGVCVHVCCVCVALWVCGHCSCLRYVEWREWEREKADNSGTLLLSCLPPGIVSSVSFDRDTGGAGLHLGVCQEDPGRKVSHQCYH